MIQFSPEGKTELLKAFIAAQGEMGAVLKSAKNDHFKTKYADLASVMEAVMPALTKNGLALIQSSTFEDEIVSVETIIAHNTGGMMSTTLRARPQNATPQGIGSVLTYLRRYSLMAITGVAPEDDDGNAGSAMTSAPRAQQSHTQAAPTGPGPGDAAMCEAALGGLGAVDDGAELVIWWGNNAVALKRALNADQWAKVEKLKNDLKARFESPAATFDEAA